MRNAFTKQDNTVNIGIRKPQVAVYRLFLSEWERLGVLPARGGRCETVSKIEEYVRANDQLHITAAGTARWENVSYSYMARLLSETLGVGFCDLLLGARVDMAKKCSPRQR